MSYGEELLLIFHNIQKGASIRAIEKIVGCKCKDEITALMAVNVYMRRNVISVNGYEVHRTPLNETAFQKLCETANDNWTHDDVVLSYIYTVALLLYKDVVFYNATPEMIKELKRIATHVTNAAGARPAHVPEQQLYKDFDEYSFLYQLNNRHINGGVGTDILKNLHNGQQDADILTAWVSNPILNKMCKLLTGLQQYDEFTVAGVYLLCLYMIRYPEADPADIFTKRLQGCRFPQYLTSYGWNPRNAVLHYA